MPQLYERASTNFTGQEIYNGLIADSVLLQNAGMPFAAADGVANGVENSQQIGELLYNNINLANMFIPELLNRVALTLTQSKYWEDPWASLEKGYLGYGEIVQEVFIKMSKPHTYSPKQAEETVFQREIPDIATAFHQMNYQKFYKQTISNEELRSAFLSWESLVSFITGIIQNMFTAANYDSFQVKKYMIALALINGGIGTHQVPAITDKESAETAVADARAISRLMEIMSPNYNYMKVPNFVRPRDQVIILNAWAEGKIDVSVLAADFNMDKAEFLSMGRLITDGFGSIDMDRIEELFGNDSNYVALTTAQLTALNAVPFVIMDRSFFQIYDKFNGVTNIYNNEGLYWNYTYHVWKILGISPFANVMAFTTVAPGITSVTVSPSAVTVTPGQQAKLSATVVTTGFASQDVVWASSNENVTVSQNGTVTVQEGATGTASITATSAVDSTKVGTATVTVATGT